MYKRQVYAGDESEGHCRDGGHYPIPGREVHPCGAPASAPVLHTPEMDKRPMKDVYKRQPERFSDRWACTKLYHCMPYQCNSPADYLPQRLFSLLFQRGRNVQRPTLGFGKPLPFSKPCLLYTSRCV